MHLRQKGLSLLLGAVILITPAFAITADDIRGYYGVGYGYDVTPYQTELDALTPVLRTAEEIESYNQMLEEYSFEELDAKIDALSSRLIEITGMLDNCIDLPFADILGLEAEYTLDVERINDLLQVRDYALQRDRLTQTEDVEALQQREAELIDLLENATFYDEIGELGVWPVVGVKHQYNSGFGTRWDPITQASYTTHVGVDLYAPMSTPVIATFSGTVYQTAYSTGSGWYIYLDHGLGVRTFYCHLSQVQVSQGQVIEQGQQIALSGNTGTQTTGPHLHYGIYIDGTPVDPKVVLEHD